MRRLAACILAVWVAASGALAQSNPVVLELFTSQGCSSCPPADALLAELAQNDDVIALALHIDYWDYIGWKDKFAQPRFTARQKGYARRAGHGAVYTPQMIVNGTYGVVGNRSMDVTEIIEKQRGHRAPVRLEVTRSGDILTIDAKAESPVGAAQVHLVRYTPSETVDIRRGENAGRSLTYTHIVTDWTVIADWNGRGALDVTAKISGDAPVVILVQSADFGAILAAARLR